MPELPDIVVYIEALGERLAGKKLDRIRIAHPFLVRTFDPPLDSTFGRTVRGFRRLGKRIVFELDDNLFLVLHLMIAGRLHWKPPGTKVAGRIGLAAFDFTHGTLTLTEAGTKRQASLHVVKGEAALAAHNPAGLEVLDADASAFRAVLQRHNHTLKRALTDPRLFSGIGNSYSDEILHRARFSPLTWTSRLTEAEATRLFEATVEVLNEWTDRLRGEAKGKFPEKVTAFRPEMAVRSEERRVGKEC